MSDLPFPHGLFNCQRDALFRTVARSVAATHRKRRLPLERNSSPSSEAKEFFACPYHHGDWQRIANASVEIVRASPPGGPYEEACAEVV